MFYPDEVVEEVRQRNDIVDVISEYVPLKKIGSTYKCCCPFHSEKTPSFIVSREKQMYHCFGCGAGGNVYTFVMKYENYTFPEAIQRLASRANIQLPEHHMTNEEKARIGRRETLLQINKNAAAYFHYLLTKTERGSAGYQYYKERGYTDETILRFGLGYADIYMDDLYKYLKSKGFSDELMRAAGVIKIDEKKGVRDVFWNRVIVPIADMNDKIIGFGGRVLGDGLPKYVNTEETEIFNKGRNLFAMNIAKKSRRRGIILCEGYMDVIAQHQAGFDNAVASLGTAFTEAQAGLIKRYSNEVYLAYDNDGAGKKALLRAIGILRNQSMDQRVISLVPYKDPDEFIKNLGKDAYEERIREAIPGRMFEVKLLAEECDLTKPDEKTKFMHRAAALLAGITDKTERVNYVESVAEEYKCDRSELKRLVSEIGLSGMAEGIKIDEDDFDNGQNYVVKAAGQAGGRPLKEKTKPEVEAEEYLLSLMISTPALFEKLESVVSEEDFTEAGVSEVAKRVFAQYRETGKVVPASILNNFDEADIQESVTRMMTRSFDYETGPEALSAALTDIVRKVKIKNIEKLQKSGTGNVLELARKKNQVRNIVIRV